MFGGGPGPWDESWKGWWGDNPPSCSEAALGYSKTLEM
jgi:hypothetical protein